MDFPSGSIVALRGAILVMALAAMVPARAFCASSGRSRESAEEDAFRKAGAAVARSVVRIQTVGGIDRVGGLLTGTAATTGVVVSEDGYIVSSAFNFIAKPTTILVQVPGGHAFPARQVATDHLRMLTLLKTEASGLVPLRARGDKGKRVRPGQWVIAVGRTYDSPDASVSVGIVSAINRVWGKAIQTDAKVSPVNYGGPLVDIAGEVVGVIVPLSPSGKEETAGVEWYDSGIGFAVPFEDVLASVERLKKGKDLSPGLLGVTFKEHGIDERPVIDVVRYDSPAERAGLKPGDVLSEIDGQPIGRFDEIKMALGRKYAGDRVEVVATRGDSRIRVEMQLVDALHPFEPGFLGILPSRVSGSGARGVLVRFVFPRSAAETAGIASGDRVRKWNGTDVADAEQLASLVRRTKPGKSATVVILRSSAEKTVQVKVTADVDEIPPESSGIPCAGSGNQTSREEYARQGSRIERSWEETQDRTFPRQAAGRGQPGLLGLRSGILFRRRFVGTRRLDPADGRRDEVRNPFPLAALLRRTTAHYCFAGARGSYGLQSQRSRGSTAGSRALFENLPSRPKPGCRPRIFYGRGLRQRVRLRQPRTNSRTCDCCRIDCCPAAGRPSKLSVSILLFLRR